MKAFNRGYISENHPNGFVFNEAAFSESENLIHFVSACVELGHRLAKEGKHLEEVRVQRGWNAFQGVQQTNVIVKTKYLLIKK